METDKVQNALENTSKRRIEFLKQKTLAYIRYGKNTYARRALRKLKGLPPLPHESFGHPSPSNTHKPSPNLNLSTGKVLISERNND